MRLYENEDLDKVVLHNSINLIAAGLLEKDRLLQKNPDHYPYSLQLMQGINIFLQQSLKAGKADDRIWNYADEASFFENFLKKPVSEWFFLWDPDVVRFSNIMEEPYYNCGAFLCNDEVSDDCIEYLQAQDHDLTSGTEQREVYNILKGFEQEEYVDVRKFIIEHPIAALEDIVDLKKTYIENPEVSKVLNYAYESFEGTAYRCPVCGWTLRDDGHSYRCHSYRCTRIRPILDESMVVNGSVGDIVRLRKGVMRYICAPGKLELQIEKYCEKNGLSHSLWPMKDHFDIGIEFPDKKIWQIDAKDYGNPFLLRNKVKDDMAFCNIEMEKGFYVVPDERVREFKRYTKIVNSGLKGKGVTCISFHQLKSAIRKRLEECHVSQKN